tara:strand:+ start:72 stop:239 length:168 start_codon:yes stop_codon:yes gene_type:complete
VSYKSNYKKSKEEIVKPSKSMMVDTTTGEGANIFPIKKDKTKNPKFYGYTNIKKY